MDVAEGKERLERILASIQDAFVSLDARLRYSFVNTNAALLLGAKKEGTCAVVRVVRVVRVVSCF
jgi:PAS domain-containing protein